MRAFVVALAVLIAVITASFRLSAKTREVCERMDETASRVLGDPEAAAELRKIWDKEKHLVRIGVKRSLADRVEEALDEIDAAKDADALRLAVVRLREALKQLS
ncbi:MAG: hypothetical protein IJV00_01675 [Clostridia bacterium]|nr:hypothetical protein [Clostridia bacterium]